MNTRGLRLLRLVIFALTAVMALSPLRVHAASEHVATRRRLPQDAQVPAGVPDGWWSKAQQAVRAAEYRITWQESTGLVDLPAAYQAPNRAHGFRSYFAPDGLRVVPRLADASSWQWRLSLASFGRAGATKPASAPTISVKENRVEYRRDGIIEWLANDPQGIEHGFQIDARPARDGLLVLQFRLGGDLVPSFAPDHTTVDFITPGGVRVLRYSELHVKDATGSELPSRIESSDAADGSGLRIAIDDTGAAYPLTIDPLLSSPSWTAEGNQVLAGFGWSVATAGDVNGDGFSDLVVGAYRYDSGQTDEGKIFLYYGSVSGLPSSPSWTAEANQSVALFGSSVATAGDVNGDGFSDLLVGASQYDAGQTDEGAAFAFLGSATGLDAGGVRPSGTPANADWRAEGNQSSAHFGATLASAGDVNGDGRSDVIIGADGYDGVETDEGAAFLFTGSTSGLSSSPGWMALGGQATAGFGAAVAGAADVNGDGYADLVIGAPGYTESETGEGKVFVYYGSAAGPSSSPDWVAVGTQVIAGFGSSVATAGDVNGDWYADVVVGDPGYSNGQSNEGAALVYLGSSNGLAGPSQNRAIGTPQNADWKAEGNQVSAGLGSSVASAGDVNGDGYADVVAGAEGYSSGESGEGAAFVWFGSTSGLATAPSWTVEGNQPGAQFSRVATGGDVNGDGFSDVIVGAPRYDNPETDEGRAYVYLGAAGGLATTEGWTAFGAQNSSGFGYSAAGAGDVNGDGYSDVIVGAPYYDNSYSNQGRAFLYFGSSTGLLASPSWFAEVNQPSGQFGYSVAGAGDVNGDGYSDVIVGAPYYDNNYGDQGRAFVYLGSPTGLLPTPAWFAEVGQSSADFGYSVAGAGDVNGDGYADVLVGALYFDSTCTDSGRAYLFEGTASGLSVNPLWTFDGSQCYSHLGFSVAAAGDVNGDGYGDVVIGEPDYDSYCGDNGRALVFHGSAAGLGASPAWTSGGNSCSEEFGWSVSTAGDVNGDGYSDIVVGAPQSYQYCTTNAGRAYVYRGSPSGIQPGPWTTLEYCQYDLRFGETVSSAGDVNGDGYSDLLIGAPRFDYCYPDQGWAGLYLGSQSGASNTPAWQTPQQCEQYYANIGKSVASAGDVNGDGYSDVLVGAPNYDHNYSDEGRVTLYYGNNGPGVSLRPQQRRADDTAPIAPWGWSDSQTSFRLAGSGRTPFGLGHVKLEWEVKPIGSLLDGSDLARGASWMPTGPTAPSLDELVEGLVPSTAYHWRIRFLYDPATTPFQQRSRWLTGAWNGPQEIDLALPKSASLTLTMTDSPDPYILNYDTVGITYSLQVANAGPEQANVSIVDTLPAGVSFVSASPSQGSCSQSGGVVSCGLGVIPVSGTATVAIVGNPTTSGTVVNHAELQTSFIDPDLSDNAAQVSTTVLRAAIGDRVWEDRDGDGVQEPGEPGIVAALVYLFDGAGNFLDVTFTNANGAYRFENVMGGRTYVIRFIPPTGYVLSPRDVGAENSDSDADPLTGNTMPFLITSQYDSALWDAGMVPSVPCAPPDEAIYLYSMTLSSDGNHYPILHFMDFNRVEQVTGYNVYRSGNSGVPPAQWSLVASDVVDGDHGTANNQWVDISGDPPPGQIWYYNVTAYNHRCPAEGPW